MYAAASMMAAAPEPIKQSLLCSQAHSLTSLAFKVLWDQREVAHTCALFSQETGGRKLRTCALNPTLQPLQVSLGRTAICAGATAQQPAGRCSSHCRATSAAFPLRQSLYHVKKSGLTEVHSYKPAYLAAESACNLHKEEEGQCHNGAVIEMFKEPKPCSTLHLMAPVRHAKHSNLWLQGMFNPPERAGLKCHAGASHIWNLKTVSNCPATAVVVMTALEPLLLVPKCQNASSQN